MNKKNMSREMGFVSPPPEETTYLRNSNWLFEENKGTNWTVEENKMFEDALALFDKETPDRWYNVAAMIPGKTVNDVIKQYRELVDDVTDIEAGLIPVPASYMTTTTCTTNSFTLDWINHDQEIGASHDFNKRFHGPSHGKRNTSNRSSEYERKKGIPWTEEEHRQFLLGLKKYGKGDWRNISRNFVTTRTPTQVASHAQKYFIRQISGGKDKRRSSIHDITTVNRTEMKENHTSSNSPENSVPSPQKPHNLSNQKSYIGFKTYGLKLHQHRMHSVVLQGLQFGQYNTM